MRTSEKVGLISTAIGAVLTLAAGTGLSLLLNGFVEGFLVLALLAISILLFLFFRNLSAHQLQWKEYRSNLRLVRAEQLAQAEERERVEGRPPRPTAAGYDERVPLVRRRDDTDD